MNEIKTFKEYVQDLNESKDDKITSLARKHAVKIAKDIRDANIERSDILQAVKDDLGEYLSDLTPIHNKEKSWFGFDSYEEAEDYFYDKLEFNAKSIAKKI